MVNGKMNGQIFISYRRDNASYPAGRLYDRLSAHFPKNQIFMDVDSLDLGIDLCKSYRRKRGVLRRADRSYRPPDLFIASTSPGKRKLRSVSFVNARWPALELLAPGTRMAADPRGECSNHLRLPQGSGGQNGGRPRKLRTKDIQVIKALMNAG
jgi:hypothetical protein